MREQEQVEELERLLEALWQERAVAATPCLEHLDAHARGELDQAGQTNYSTSQFAIGACCGG